MKNIKNMSWMTFSALVLIGTLWNPFSITAIVRGESRYIQNTEQLQGEEQYIKSADDTEEKKASKSNGGRSAELKTKEILKEEAFSTNQDFTIEGTTLLRYNGTKKRVIIPDGVETIGNENNDVFAGTSVEEVIVPDSVKTISFNAFFRAYNLRRVELGSGVSKIENFAFGLSSLEEIVVSEANKNYYAENNALINKKNHTLIQYCIANKTTEYRIPDGVEFLEQYSFAGSDYIESIVIPDSVTGTSLMVFSDCLNLKKVEIGSGLHSVYGCIFTNTPSLEIFEVHPENRALYVEDGVLRMRNSDRIWFYPAGKKDKSYHIPEGVNEVWFNQNPYLETLYVSKDVNSMRLDNMASLKTIVVDEENKYYCVIDDVLYSYDKSILISYPGGKSGTDFVVPNSVKMLGNKNYYKSEVFPRTGELQNIIFSNTCPRNEEGESPWNDWIGAFWKDKTYDIYYYNDSAWEDLREAYNNQFGQSFKEIDLNFHPVKKGYEIIASKDRIKVGENTRLSVVVTDLEKGIIMQIENPDFWQVEDGKNTIDQDGIFTGVVEGTAKIIAKGKSIPDLEKEIIVEAKTIVSEGDNSIGGSGNNSGGNSISGENTGNGNNGTGSSSGGSSGGGGSSNGSSGGSSGGSSSGGSSGGGGSRGGSSRGGSSSSTGGPGTFSSLPEYVVQGIWIQHGDLTWEFVNVAGVKLANEWAAVENPYALTSLGQQAFDWFRFDENGKMITGWYFDVADGYWYYLNPVSDNTLGKMMTGWVTINGQFYYFNQNSDGHRGRMYTNEMTPDGCYVDGSGVWNGF